MPKRLLLLLLILLAPVAASPRAELVFKYRGEPIKILSLTELEKMVPSRDLTIFEPHEKRNRSYRVIALEDLLKAVYEKRWEGHDELLITCLDGYQPTVPGPYVQAHRGYLAFASADGLPFRLNTETRGVQECGPFYLIWDNQSDPTMHKDESHYWPYQVHVLDLIRFDEKFERVIPPEGASPAARRGFADFRRFCIMCHAINGQGGIKAELNYPVNVTEYWEPGFLAQWIKNPQSIRHKAEMKGLAESLPERDRVVSDLIEYLKAMKVRKIAP
ncbi:MAG: hypothetical protein AMXMBFR33_49030 [Candidatus Xenobia bacterium]